MDDRPIVGYQQDAHVYMTCLLVEELRYLSCVRSLRLKKADLHSQRNRQLAHAGERLFRLVGLQQIHER